MGVAGVHHVNLRVDDLAAATEFYEGILGLARRSDRPADSGEGCWLDAGAQQLHLSVGAPPDDRGQHVALDVDDLDATIAELGQKGVTVIGGDRPSTRGQVVIHDPSGNRIELRRRS